MAKNAELTRLIGKKCRTFFDQKLPYNMLLFLDLIDEPSSDESDMDEDIDMDYEDNESEFIEVESVDQQVRKHITVIKGV